ncbi:hypothetical protein OAD74_07565 [Alphaproteobacteria bacterium]|nr:hypothetical protein [Alphaproteobacteria bacterium]
MTEAGGSIGYGHLMRCVAIAQNITCECQIVVHSDLGFSHSNVQQLAWRDDLSALEEYLGDTEVNAILIDSYLTSVTMLRALRGMASFICVLDDYNRITYPVDVVINPSLIGPKYDSQQACVLAGKDFVILRREILQHKKKLTHSDLKHIVLTFGGSDKIQLFLGIIPVLLESNFIVSAVAGSDARAIELTSRFLMDGLHVHGRLDTKDLADLFVSTDLVISAGGQTLNELAYLGAPFLAIEAGKDQFWNIEAYVSNYVTPEHFEATDPHLMKKIVPAIELLRGASTRHKMSQKGMGLIDGCGARKIAALLQYQQLDGYEFLGKHAI